MSLLTKINGLAFANINKVNSLARSSTDKVSGTRNFLDNNAVARSITSSDVNHAIYIADSDGDYRIDHDDAFSVSFWIKVGWDVSLNTYVYGLASHDVGGSYNDDMFRVYYYEPHNRIWVEWRSASSHKRQQFWHFHDNYGTYAVAYAAAGLGATYWNSSNRGNVGDDDYTLITVTRGTANTSVYANLKLYWNATDCGQGYYKSGSGGGAGTPNMGNSTDKVVALGSNSWAFGRAGNNTEGKYNGLTLWNKELSSGEVSELYNGGTPLHVGTHSAYANCIGWYDFEDDGAGEVSGNAAFAINGDSNLEAK